ncbi:hypothetical protein GIB67_018936 [Kingdonia uniflora]|uniref:Uncharacterized protein n=1 Tax=Kingdonia uniflora TaxID=39325 RepID=A0A7J7L2U4_9MAGN|nr:hypothetical protein GIB67_018936 [Kingdonia uniflora]
MKLHTLVNFDGDGRFVDAIENEIEIGEKKIVEKVRLEAGVVTEDSKKFDGDGLKMKHLKDTTESEVHRAIDLVGGKGGDMSESSRSKDNKEFIQDLRTHQKKGDTPLSPVYKVVKTVYASPSCVNFHLDSRKEVETVPAYPDICFAVDDFDSTFDAVVLTETDQCYCVLLNAHGGAAFPIENQVLDCSSSNSTYLRTDTDSGRDQSTKLTLFSGFVGYEMVREAYDDGKSGLGSLLSAVHFSGKSDRIYMKGPGGRGEVEVAVSGIVDQSQHVSDPSSPISRNTFGVGLGTIVRKAASAASIAARHAYAAAATTRRSDEQLLPLKCCLMSITLSWEHIAHDLLFKVSPPVDI